MSKTNTIIRLQSDFIQFGYSIQVPNKYIFLQMQVNQSSSLPSQFKTYRLHLQSSTERMPHTHKKLSISKFKAYEESQQPKLPRTKSQFARRTMAKTSRDPGWKNLFESNGISPDLGRQKLTHRDIAKLSEIIKKESSTLNSIRRILYRFEQQVKIQTADSNEQKTIVQKRNQFIQNFSIKIKSHIPQSLFIKVQNSKSMLPQRKSLMKAIPQERKTQQKKIRISKTRSLSILKTKKVKQFQIDSEISKEFQQKLYKYLEFLFLINLSNRVFRDLDSSSAFTPKYHIGYGNNNLIIQSLMKKRGWWQEGSKQESNFVWTQLKINYLYSRQQTVSNQYEAFDAEVLLQKSDNKTLDTIQKQPILRLFDVDDWNYIKKTLTASKQKFQKRILKFNKSLIKIQDQNKNILVTNHLPKSYILGNKKDLFLSLRLYYQLKNQNIWNILPQTYYIKSDNDQQFERMKQAYHKNDSKIWIIKPAQFTNRGQGIRVSNNIEQIKNMVTSQQSSKYKSFIIQHYINNPYLYYKRKFDIRCYMLLTSNNGVLKGYWYQQGYIRTSSQIYDLDNLDNTYTHLTNDAIQKNSKKYGKYEEGNKLSYADFQRYLINIKSKHNFYIQCLPKMKKVALDAIRSTSIFLNKQSNLHNFQIFGLDFMINSKFQIKLIQINTNPCLQTSCTLLSRIIPNMLENAFRIGLDPIFPPPNNPNTIRYSISQNAILFNKFELIFDQIKEKQRIQNLYKDINQNNQIIVNQKEQEQEAFQFV